MAKPPNIPAKDLLRPDEVARCCDVTRRTIYNWIETGKLDAIRLPGGELRIRRDDLMDILNPSK